MNYFIKSIYWNNVKEQAISAVLTNTLLFEHTFRQTGTCGHIKKHHCRAVEMITGLQIMVFTMIHLEGMRQQLS